MQCYVRGVSVDARSNNPNMVVATVRGCITLMLVFAAVRGCIEVTRQAMNAT